MGLLTWYLSLIASIYTFTIGVVKKSWIFMLISTITFVPIAYYFSGARNAWEYVGLTPFVLLLLTIVFWFLKRTK